MDNKNSIFWYEKYRDLKQKHKHFYKQADLYRKALKGVKTFQCLGDQDEKCITYYGNNHSAYCPVCIATYALQEGE